MVMLVRVFKVDLNKLVMVMVDPEDVSETLAHYRCSVCGAEVTMTMANNVEVSNPRHCREDMVLVWRPE